MNYDAHAARQDLRQALQAHGITDTNHVEQAEKLHAAGFDAQGILALLLKYGPAILADLLAARQNKGQS